MRFDKYAGVWQRVWTSMALHSGVKFRIVRDTFHRLFYLFLNGQTLHSPLQNQSPSCFSPLIFFLSFLFFSFFLYIVFPLFLFRMSLIPIIFKRPTVNSLLLCYHNVGTTIQALVLFVGRVCLDYVLIDTRACVPQKKSLGKCIPSKIEIGFKTWVMWFKILEYKKLFYEFLYTVQFILLKRLNCIMYSTIYLTYHSRLKCPRV